MPSHVHVLVTLLGAWRLEVVVRVWKAYTACMANRILKRRGSFWSRDYFDRLIRDERHFNETVWYIHENPVRAGLCDTAEAYRWSSASTASTFAAARRGGT
jgi:putative transposase